MIRNTKLLVLLLALVLVGSITASCSSDAPEKGSKQQFINIGTGGTAGTYFPLGGAFAEIWNSSIDGINATAQSTGASVANINLMRDGKLEVATIQNDIAYYAESGKLMFEGDKYSDIRGLMTLYNEPIQIVSLDKDVKTLKDLKGKKVAVGAVGGCVAENAKQILAAAGLDFENDIDARYLSFSEAAGGLKDKQIDAAFIIAGAPTAAIQDIAAQHDVVIIPIEGETASTLLSEYKYFTEYTIPANTYNGQAEEVKTLTVKAMLITTSKLDEELVYQLVKSIYENHDRVVAAHNVGKYITPETGLQGMSIMLHPGAERYFKEKGLK